MQMVNPWQRTKDGIIQSRKEEKKYAPAGIFDLVYITRMLEPGPRPWQGRIIPLDNRRKHEISRHFPTFHVLHSQIMTT
jgi:hypothetical protein